MPDSEINEDKTYRLNKDAEHISKYENTNWRFTHNDHDLRIVPKVRTDVTNAIANKQMVTALKLALDIISAHVSSVTKKEKRITFEQFEATRYDLVQTVGANGDYVNMKCPVEFKATFNEKVRGREGGITFQAEINIDNPKITPELQGPHGPHVGYLISACNVDKKEVPKCVGHILLNKSVNLPSRDGSDSLELGDIMHLPTATLFEGLIAHPKES